MQKAIITVLICFNFVLVSLPAHAAKAKLERGPYLQNLQENAITIMWRTSKRTASIVKYGTKPGEQNKTVSDYLQKKKHKIRITGLKANTKYFYSVYSKKKKEKLLAGESADFYFISSPKKSNSQAKRIWVLGDAGSNSVRGLFSRKKFRQNDVRDAYYKFNDKHTDMILLLGDNAYTRGKDKEYQEAIFDSYEDIIKNTPMWSAFGNHDLGLSLKSKQFSAQSYPKARGVYYDIFDFPQKPDDPELVPSETEAYYSFDYGNIHFISLDSTDSLWQKEPASTNLLKDSQQEEEQRKKDTSEKCYISPKHLEHIGHHHIPWHKDNEGTSNAMLEWLEKDLKANKQLWTIAFWHHSPYSIYVDKHDITLYEKWMRENVNPILEKHGVDLVLTGHDHRYQRSYLINGNYGHAHEFEDSMIVDKGQIKEYLGEQSYTYEKKIKDNKGTLYIVTGSAGRSHEENKKNQKYHPAMQYNSFNMGSLVLDIEGSRLDARFINADEEIQDRFSLVKKRKWFAR